MIYVVFQLSKVLLFLYFLSAKFINFPTLTLVEIIGEKY